MAETIRIAGVPEHFNLPWHMALEEGAFSRRGIDLEWTDVPEGTGKMCDMLREGAVDLAVVLTEGFVRAAAGGLDASIAQEYVASPLLWGIHVAASSIYRETAELENRVAAISRFGSGSHLMAFVNARNQGWVPANLRFQIVNTLDGAIAALGSGEADYFMWERFTTQPIVDEGIFRRIGDCPTPWPCFVLACSGDFSRNHPGILSDILEVINTFTLEFTAIPSIDRTLANRYGQKLEDIREWLGLTRWSQNQISYQNIEIVINTLLDLKLINKSIDVRSLLL